MHGPSSLQVNTEIWYRNKFEENSYIAEVKNEPNSSVINGSDSNWKGIKFIKNNGLK